LLVKKLEDLSPPTTQEEADQLKFFAQHLERLLTKANMDGLTVLTKVGKQKKQEERQANQSGIWKYPRAVSGLMEVLIGN
jgi:hypothetical protein